MCPSGRRGSPNTCTKLAAFPNGKHDDQVDSTAQMLDWFKGTARETSGFYGYYRMLAQKPDAADPV